VVPFGGGAAGQEVDGVLAVTEDEDGGVLVDWSSVADKVSLEHGHGKEFCDVVTGLAQALEAPEEPGWSALVIIPPEEDAAACATVQSRAAVRGRRYGLNLKVPVLVFHGHGRRR
jgi:hypothetical protein